MMSARSGRISFALCCLASCIGFIVCGCEERDVEEARETAAVVADELKQEAEAAAESIRTTSVNVAQEAKELADDATAAARKLKKQAAPYTEIGKQAAKEAVEEAKERVGVCVDEAMEVVRQGKELVEEVMNGTASNVSSDGLEQIVGSNGSILQVAPVGTTSNE